MNYLIYPTKEQAEIRNNQEAIARGCQSPTIYWWSMRETNNGSWALLVGNEEIDEPEFSTEEPEWLNPVPN